MPFASSVLASATERNADESKDGWSQTTSPRKEPQQTRHSSRPEGLLHSVPEWDQVRGDSGSMVFSSPAAS